MEPIECDDDFDFAKDFVNEQPQSSKGNGSDKENALDRPGPSASPDGPVQSQSGPLKNIVSFFL